MQHTPIQTVLDGDFGNLVIAIRDVASLSPDEFTLSRRNGIGASDTAKAAGVAYKGTAEDVVADKLQSEITDEERAIGKLKSVQLGRYLEPLILDKFKELHQVDELVKPIHTYKHKLLDYMTINFDGVIEEDGKLIPVETKFVSTGGKYYNKETADVREKGKTDHRRLLQYSGGPQQRLIAQADRLGIPKYYYPQVQTQIWGLDAPYGYFAALFDREWELCYWKVPRDPEDMSYILACCEDVWHKVMTMRGLT